MYEGIGRQPIAEETDENDYEADVSKLVEMGTLNSNVVTSWDSWRADAYLLPDLGTRVPLEKLITMRRTDGMARAIANLVTLPLKMALQQGKWIAPPEGDAEEEVEFANLLWSTPPTLGGMTTPSSLVFGQMLLAVFDGFSVFEPVTHIPTHGPLKGKRTLKKLAYRDPRTVTLLQDERGGYAGFRQLARLPNGKLRDVTLSPLKSLLFTVNGHENPLYGVSYFESAYVHYEQKLRWYYMASMAGQFSAVPGRIGTIPRNAKVADARAFKQALEAFSFNPTMVMKEGYKVDPFNPMSGFNFLSYIEHHNLMMAKSVLASFLESEQRTVLVENTTQDASADLFLLSMETLADDFASVLTHHLMPKYIVENFKGSNKFPVFKPGPISDDARRRIASMFEKVVVSGILNSTPEMVRELEKHVARDLGLDIDYEEIEARELEAAQQQAEQAEMLAAQAQQESIEEERAADGGLPDSAVSSDDFKATRTRPGEEGDIPEEANSGVSLSDEADVTDDWVQAANDLLRDTSKLLPRTYATDEGF